MTVMNSFVPEYLQWYRSMWEARLNDLEQYLLKLPKKGIL
jgi:hypothetical protein